MIRTDLLQAEEVLMWVLTTRFWHYTRAAEGPLLGRP